MLQAGRGQRDLLKLMYIFMCISRNAWQQSQNNVALPLAFFGKPQCANTITLEQTKQQRG